MSDFYIEINIYIEVCNTNRQMEAERQCVLTAASVFGGFCGGNARERTNFGLCPEALYQ